MSENNVSFAIAGLAVTTMDQLNSVMPAWLADALLVGQCWQDSGLLDRLAARAVSQGRAILRVSA